MARKKGHAHPAPDGAALAPTSDTEKEPAVDDLRKQQEETEFALEEESAKLTKKTTHFEEIIQELEIKMANLEEQKATQNFAPEFFKDEIAKLKLVDAEKESVESRLETAGAALKRANSELDYVLKEMDETKKASELVISDRDAYQSQLDDKKVEKEATNGELERPQLKLCSLETEKKRLLFELEWLNLLFSEAFEDWKNELEQMEQERAAAADLNGMHEMDLSALGSEMHQLLSNESKLQEQHKANTKLNVQMQPAVEYTQRDLQRHVEEATNSLKLQIEELTKNNEDTTRKLELVKAQFNDLVVNSDKKETKIGSMEGEKSKLERELADAKLALSEMEGQARTAKLNFDRALSLLRSTSEFVCSLEERECSVVVLVEAAEEQEQELEGDVQEFAKDLKAMRSVFENGAAEKAEMTRELNLLQEAAVDAQNRSRMWAWVCLAATLSFIVVAASLAYATTMKGPPWHMPRP